MTAPVGNGGDEPRETHDINVTPLIDVMLVLLIVFMVAAPLATVEVPVDLPASTASPARPPEEPVFVTVKADKSVIVGERPASIAALPRMLDLAAGGDKERRLFLRADKTIDYGTLMEVINGLRGAGYLKVALVGLEAPPATSPPLNNPPETAAR